MRWPVEALRLAVVAVMFVLLMPAGAAAESFRILEVRVEARLDPEGPMRVVESITYELDGDFSVGERAIPPGPYRLTDFRVTDETGASLPTSGEPHNLKWEFGGAGDRRTFQVAYTVRDHLRVGSDVADLRWQWVGPKHPGLEHARVELRVPGDGAGVHAWVHGPRSAGVGTAGPVITWQARELEAGESLEGRVALPVLALEVPPGPAPILPAIVADEAAEAEEANRRRSILSFPSDDPLRIERLNRWFVVIPLIGWIVFALLWREWGSDPPTRRDSEPYRRLPPADPPALASPLLKSGTVDERTVAATIVDLAARGALHITEVPSGPGSAGRVDWRFRRGAYPAGLLPFEEKILVRMFAEGDDCSHSTLMAWTRENPRSARRWWLDFCESVGDEVRARQYLESGPALPFLLNIVVAAVVLVVSVNALLVGAVVGLLGIASAVLQLIATYALGRRTPKGARRAAEWKAFRQFLLDFSNIRRAPGSHLALWERYMVYGVALGVSEEVAKGIAMKLPAEEAPGFAAWYQGAGAARLPRFGVVAPRLGSALVPVPDPVGTAERDASAQSGAMSAG